MHWGHAVSTDLVHWKELPIAIYPHKFGDWVFSGSAVVDADNTAGFKTGDQDVIVAAYTSTGRGEAIAYSNDRGRTFTDFSGNPVVKHSGRDPKVIWYAPGKHWVMALFDEDGKSGGIAFYTSTNLKNWQRASRIDGYHECPEIFEIALDGKPDSKKWVVYGADGAYQVGSFDGKTFTPDGGKLPFNRGNCFYASQTFSDIPASDGRRIQIAWGRINTPGMPFNQCMLFPVKLTLRTTDAGPRLFAMPVREIEKLHAKKHQLKDQAIEPGKNPLAAVEAELMDISAAIDCGRAAEVSLVVRGTPVTYDVAKQMLTCGGKTAPLKCPGGKLKLRILVDRNSIEIFANDGEVYMPIGKIHPADNRKLEISSKDGAAKATELTVWELRSAWE
jgi:fructan beta-fructosidase